MAKVYSWEVSINPYAYAYIVHPNDTERAYVGTELKGNNLQKVIDWVAECSDEDYIEHFNMVKELCEEKNYSVKFENVNAYMDVNTSCDNLRGPAGKGIINITLTNSTELADTYTINYTDGTNTSFVVRHGKQGEQGEQGKPGDRGVRTYFAMIYTSGRGEWDQILGTVDTPTGGEYDYDENKLTLPTGWYESDTDENNVSLKPPVWMSSRTFSETNTGDNGWSKPVMISGENGKPGVDGASLEFIYKRATTVSNAPTQNENRPGFVPEKEGWYGSPKGVDENNRREWFTTRLYNKTEEKWGDWNTPAIWSQYGVNGQDGDGIEYIYYLASKSDALDNPTPNNYETNEGYKEDEWTPSKMGGNYTNIDGDPISKDIADNWTDNPTGVDGTNQWEWVAVRKYSGKDKKWGPFSDPSLWSKYGEDGQPGANATTIRKVYKMTNSTNEVPDPPTDNLYTDWNNAFPVDYTIDQCVWCCEAEIWANNNEFVQKYRKLSKSEITTEIEINAIGVGGTSVPTQKIGHEGDYIKMMYSGEYYVWDEGGWSKPYLVTGTKGVDATPMDYVTYVFYYGNRNNPPTGGPIGETGEGKTLEYIKTYGWIDFPDTKNGERVDNDTNCWYQCCLAMNSDNTIKSWGGIHPCNGKDGDALPGKYTEFRFAVTNNDNGKPDKPELTDEDRDEREPKSTHKGTNIIWKATGEDNFPTLGENQTMWQIFAVIDPNGNDGKGGVTDVLVEKWEGPIQVSAENGKNGADGEEGPAGKQGVSGIPGANFKVKYCLGTFSEKTGECYWKVTDDKGNPEWDGWSDTPETVKYGSGYFGKDPSKFNNLNSTNYWFDFPPNSEIIKYDKSDFGDYKSKAYEGRVIRRKTSGGGYVFSFIYYNDESKEYANRDISTITLTLEEAENFRVYVWCVQGTETWKKQTTSFDYDKTTGNVKNDVNISNGITWGIPFKLQGTNGLNGLKGADGRSQTVYPMGVYDSNEVYLTTESKAPYVYDPNDSNFYVLNRVNEPWVGDLPDDFEKVIIHPSTANSGNTATVTSIPSNKGKEFIIYKGHAETISGNIYSGNTFYYQWSEDKKVYVPASYYKYAYKGVWIVDQDGTTPCQNYQNNITNNHEPAWVKFESFEALYTSIGIIENGMIGSAVYNNEFMFSQQGIDENGNITNYASESAENGGGFLSGYEYDREGEVDESGAPTGRHWKRKDDGKYISDDDVNPYEMKGTYGSTTPIHSFRPNITLNFKTGQAYLSTGEITFSNGTMTANTGIFNNVVVNGSGTLNKRSVVINNDNDFDKYFVFNNSGYYMSLTSIPDIIMINYWPTNSQIINLPYYYAYVDNYGVYDVDKSYKYIGEFVYGQAPHHTGDLAYNMDYGFDVVNGVRKDCDINGLRALIGRELLIFNNTAVHLTCKCGPCFTRDNEDDTEYGVTSYSPQTKWEVPLIKATDYTIDDWGSFVYAYHYASKIDPDNTGNVYSKYETQLRARSSYSLTCDLGVGRYIEWTANLDNSGDIITTTGVYNTNMIGWHFRILSSV